MSKKTRARWRVSASEALEMSEAWDLDGHERQRVLALYCGDCTHASASCVSDICSPALVFEYLTPWAVEATRLLIRQNSAVKISGTPAELERDNAYRQSLATYRNMRPSLLPR